MPWAATTPRWRDVYKRQEEKCDLCGRNMVVKSGRFGRFLACPGYPECKFTKPLVLEMPGRCPKCGGRILKKTSRNGYTYYGCDKFPEMCIRDRGTTWPALPIPGRRSPTWRTAFVRWAHSWTANICPLARRCGCTLSLIHI